jgi:hypothetical protein
MNQPRIDFILFYHFQQILLTSQLKQPSNQPMTLEEYF